MSERTHLKGRYRLLNEALLREKANRTNDERHKLYKVLLANSTYESYLKAVEGVEIYREDYKQNPITGRGEILYCRRNGWIADA
ncbi:MAG TPA: hypothetical protein VGF56_09505 [Rhizomicrobium sp.]|jgi:hypothetical protein